MGGAKNLEQKDTIKSSKFRPGKECFYLEKGQHILIATVDESGLVTKPKVDKGFKKNWKQNGETRISRVSLATIQSGIRGYN